MCLVLVSDLLPVFWALTSFLAKFALALYASLGVLLRNLLSMGISHIYVFVEYSECFTGVATVSCDKGGFCSFYLCLSLVFSFVFGFRCFGLNFIFFSSLVNLAGL